jgi:hypothetical protein
MLFRWKHTFLITLIYVFLLMNFSTVVEKIYVLIKMLLGGRGPDRSGTPQAVGANQ